MSLVLGPRLVGGLPAHQAGRTGETHGHVVARLVRMVVEPGLGHLLRQRPSDGTRGQEKTSGVGVYGAEGILRETESKQALEYITCIMLKW